MTEVSENLTICVLIQGGISPGRKPGSARLSLAWALISSKQYRTAAPGASYLPFTRYWFSPPKGFSRKSSTFSTSDGYGEFSSRSTVAVTSMTSFFNGCNRCVVRYGTSAAALAIAWLIHQGDHVIPIPGTRSPDHLREHCAGAKLDLDASALAAIEAALPVGWAHGDRYSDAQWIGPEKYC